MSLVDASALPEGMTFPKFNLITRVTKKVEGMWKSTERYSSSLANVKLMDAGGAEVAEEADARKSTADVMGGPKHARVGKLLAEYVDGKIHYRFEWTGPANTSVQEIGWAFGLPSEYDHFCGIARRDGPFIPTSTSAGRTAPRRPTR